MFTKLFHRLDWQIQNVDSITGWMTLQPVETLIWKRSEIPETILNSSSLVKWLCETMEAFLPEDTMLDRAASWMKYRNEDELEFFPVLYAPCETELSAI